MARTWVLDTDTKGTGANVVPLEKVQQRPEPPAEAPKRPRRRPRRTQSDAPPPRRAARGGAPVRSATALPPGHVRKKATGEIGKVLAVDARAGTATVRWLKSGASSTVPLTAIARR